VRGGRRPRAGLAAADFLLAPDAGARLYDAEALRLRAGFRAALGAPREDVGAELERALAVARSQGARSLELRAAAGLLRHRLEAGDAGEARALLEGALAGMPEESETPDRSAAEALLARGTLPERTVGEPLRP